jgi:hypothetical protein
MNAFANKPQQRKDLEARAKEIEAHLDRYRKKTIEMQDAANKLSAELSRIRLMLMNWRSSNAQ